MFFKRFIIALIPLLMVHIIPVSAQSNGQTDSVVVLMNAKSLELIEDVVGFQYRKAIDARFLHNNTYLICDTALWYVNTKQINAYGHVQIIQDNTVLSSDKLNYLIEEDLAQFRGNMVQLMDKDGNTLRTKFLDYNTKDSIAVFERGASMRDKDGQVIESVNGTYDSKAKQFTFEEDVNMYTDSVYVKTSSLTYHTDYDFAEFFGDIDAWKGKNMLSSREGTYDKAGERFFFTGDVHVMSDTQEGWSDSLYYNRTSNDVEMYGNIQVLDTTRKVAALADKLTYVDTLSTVTLEKNATVIAETEEKDKVDTVYIGAKKFVYRTVRKCDIDGNLISAAQARLADLEADPVTAYRKKAAEEAAKAAEAAKDKDDPNDAEAAAKKRQQAAASVNVDDLKIDSSDLDNLSSPSDSLSNRNPSVEPLADTSGVSDSSGIAGLLPGADTVSVSDSTGSEAVSAVKDTVIVPDTTKTGFLTALFGVKMYKSDMQASCDSLEYCDLDSLARLFVSPVVWNEGNRQYSSDSLTIAIKDRKLEKASLMSNAFIIIQEDSVCFDQIKSTEILAYFDTTSALRRFDALGGASALFFLQENDAFATANKVESKMLSATFKDGDIDRVYYFDNPKNDAYPVVQLPKDQRQMKGFNWQPELRPEGKEDITPLELRKSERMSYAGRPMPLFNETEKYFPGHMSSIRRMLASQDSIRRARHQEELLRQQLAEEHDRMVADSLEAARRSDSLATEIHPADSLSADGSAVMDRVPASDSLSVGAVQDSLSAAESVQAAPKPSEVRRQERIEAREKRWEELDKRDAAKEAKKQARLLKKKRKRVYEQVLSAEKEAAKDQKKLDRYVEKYSHRRDRKELRHRKNL